ncbi:abortive infection system toxin AbiGii family protein [Paenibacillus durus]|uniref:Abortive phage resistance protein n=1 Tax=Paenibacillus durus ATCC 35681 TaxID=1333534 RepID=A0A0F7FC80_PAEDU|nr:abortive infection system toxin AbiGii family protein [Paenibacillus durus]AKG36437.1 hypothetical protein VK70_19365 [Paenibacillus durus ATCC 35681]
MFASFNNAFKRKDHDIKVPKEIISYLSEQLPENFQYTRASHGAVILMPQDITDMNIAIKIKYPNEEIKTSADLLEYLYRTQQEVPIQGEEIIINGIEFKVSDLIKFPLSTQNLLNSEFILSPEPFQPPFAIQIEGGGIAKEIIVQRKPLADMNKSLFESVDAGAFTISYIINEKESSLKLTFNINLEKAKTIKEIIESLILFDAGQKGKIKLFGNELPAAPPEVTDKGINETIKFWEKVIELEKRLGVTFSPNIPVSFEDARWFEKLYRSFIKERPYKEYIKLSNFTVTDVEMFEKVKDKERSELSISFINEFKLVLMGTELSLYEAAAFFNMAIKDTIPKDDKSNKFDVFVEPFNSEGIYQSTKLFDNLASAQDYQSSFRELQKAELLNF